MVMTGAASGDGTAGTYSRTGRRRPPMKRAVPQETAGSMAVVVTVDAAVVVLEHLPAARGEDTAPLRAVEDRRDPAISAGRLAIGRHVLSQPGERGRLRVLVA